MNPLNWTSRYLTTIGLAGVLTTAAPARATFVFSTATGTFTPSFRGQPNTHYFGWTPGTFDGNTPNGLLDDPEISLGDTSLDPLVSLSADPAAIISSSGNLYKNGATLNASLVVPVPGLASGFTTIIVQGGSVSSPYGSHLPIFGAAGGDLPDVVVASNANNRGQFWAKYEIVGNAGSYTIPITGTNPPNIPSIAELVVDVLWSPFGFAPDSAIAVPEPATLGLIGAAALLLSRRNNR